MEPKRLWKVIGECSLSSTGKTLVFRVFSDFAGRSFVVFVEDVFDLAGKRLKRASLYVYEEEPTK